jgi:hypothetical protein
MIRVALRVLETAARAPPVNMARALADISLLHVGSRSSLNSDKKEPDVLRERSFLNVVSHIYSWKCSTEIVWQQN